MIREQSKQTNTSPGQLSQISPEYTQNPGHQIPNPKSNVPHLVTSPFGIVPLRNGLSICLVRVGPLVVPHLLRLVPRLLDDEADSFDVAFNNFFGGCPAPIPTPMPLRAESSSPVAKNPFGNPNVASRAIFRSSTSMNLLFRDAIWVTIRPK
jgi:hypothetical protein